MFVSYFFIEWWSLWHEPPRENHAQAGRIGHRADQRAARWLHPEKIFRNDDTRITAHGQAQQVKTNDNPNDEFYHKRIHRIKNRSSVIWQCQAEDFYTQPIRVRHCVLADSNRMA